MATLHDATIDELDPRTLYRILALRSAVFVVEQDCVYLDPDGRDLEPGARQLWAEQDGEPIATLRLLREDGDIARIGRVVTLPAARSSGVAAALMPGHSNWPGPSTSCSTRSVTSPTGTHGSASCATARTSSRTASRTSRCACAADRLRLCNFLPRCAAESCTIARGRSRLGESNPGQPHYE